MGVTPTPSSSSDSSVCWAASARSWGTCCARCAEMTALGANPQKRLIERAERIHRQHPKDSGS
jgi:hypothetical protein